MKVELKQAGDWLVIQGYCDCVEVKEVIRLVKKSDDDGWHVAISSCMPTDLEKAYSQQRVVAAAFKMLREYESDTVFPGETRLLGVDETMKGLGEE